ncbi:MAG: glutathione peroxidase [Prochlorococcus sp. SP3034]|nr:glutathione peroxidase [Prochlorococcus sp. SP3034]|tara:strand:- start:514 stop:993 length:480 start_codon:yes stop_codon:yes gene_type:complete
MTVNVKNTIIINSDGQKVLLGDYEGQVLLIVNVASYCGFTAQYNDLQKLHENYSEKGLKVLAFPCNDFGNQEPGTLDEIKEFCTTNFNVKFEIFDKVKARGETTEPYTTLNKCEPEGDVEWNFEKFIVGRDSNVLARFKSSVKPFDENLIAAIEVALDS